jgi:amidohydrolase
MNQDGFRLDFHVSSGSAAGVLQVPPDIAYSSSDSVDIIVHGIGGHGASPHETVDPVLVASQIVVSLQSIVSRNINPLQPAVITVGAIHGGSKHNIIGERVDMQLTVRSDSAEVRQQLLDDIDRVAKGVAISLGVPDDKLPEVIRSKTESTPPTINDTASAELVRTALTGQFGADRMEMKPRDGMGAEDFAYFVAPEHGVKGVYFSVGGAMPADLAKPTPHHSPIFRVDYEPAVKTGAEAMVVGAMALLGKP